MNPNDDRDSKQDQKDIDEGNKASKRQEAKQRLIARQGEAVLEEKNLDKLIDEEVHRMAELASIPEPTVKEHNVHESVANSDDNKAKTGDQIPGQTTKAQNTQNQDVNPKGNQVETQDRTDVHADQKPDTGDQPLRQANAVKK